LMEKTRIMGKGRAFPSWATDMLKELVIDCPSLAQYTLYL
jgi:hypothetical protein